MKKTTRNRPKDRYADAPLEPMLSTPTKELREQRDNLLRMALDPSYTEETRELARQCADHFSNILDYRSLDKKVRQALFRLGLFPWLENWTKDTCPITGPGGLEERKADNNDV